MSTIVDDDGNSIWRDTPAQSPETTTSDAELSSVWSGSFMIGGVEIKCHTLNNGQQIIEAESMERLFLAMDTGSELTIDAVMEAFTKWSTSAEPPA